MKALPAPKPALHPKAIAVGGDDWNKQTAVRLETEYQINKPALDKIVADAVADKAEVAEPDDQESDDDAPVVPEEWDMLSNDQQEQAASEYKDKTHQDYLDSEIENWQSEHAPDEARYKVAQDFTDGSEMEWAETAIGDYIEQREGDGLDPMPYSTETLLNALTVEHDTGGYPIDKGTDIGIDDEKLEPDLVKNQMTLPLDKPSDVVPTPGVTQLTGEMRIGLTAAVETAFGKEADRVLDKLEAPDYLGDSVSEFQDESWSSMDDEDKFKWVEHNTDIVSDAEKEAEGYQSGKSSGGGIIEKVPDTFDPLEQHTTTHGENRDYKRTQLLARHLSVERAAQLLVERGLMDHLELDKEPADFVNVGEWEKWSKDQRVENARQIVSRIDQNLWNEWKSSSTSFGGKTLQVAAAAELGGRLRGALGKDSPEREEIITHADKAYTGIGGFAGVKAYVRAKWETTQYLLDKADVHVVDLYRAVDLTSRGNDGKALEATTKEKQTVNVTENVQVGFTKLPDIMVQRNGAASMTTDQSVANNWDGDKRVVLRAEVPRTAVLSVPAYGINVHGEHEVVVTGTAWVGWDAWLGKAPAVGQVPMTHHGAA